ncbi:MAG: hypothetical protein GY820_26930 [Gammaproteobacteria bacterium]|nr:hypothetical protein [Gammaproteobacteria bacterium]
MDHLVEIDERERALNQEIQIVAVRSTPRQKINVKLNGPRGERDERVKDLKKIAREPTGDISEKPNLSEKREKKPEKGRN